MNPSTTQGWKARDVALEPLAVIGCGAGAYALARRLLDRSDEELGRLRGATSGVGAISEADSTAPSQAILVVGGVLDFLPWAPDAVYLGREPSAPALLWPVHLDPPFAPDLIERALRRRFGALAVPLIVVPQWKLVVPMGESLPVQRALVAEFLAREIR